MKQSAKPWLGAVLPTINHMFGSPASGAEHGSSSPSGFYPHKQLQRHRPSLWSCVSFSLFSVLPFPFPPPSSFGSLAKEFSAIHHVQRKLYLAAAAELLECTAVENTPEDRFPSSSAPTVPTLPHPLLSADT